MLPPLSGEGDGFPGVCGEALGNHEQCGETEGCERTQDHPPGHLILPRCHLAQSIQGACPEPHKRGELWKALEEGSWEEVEALFLKALSRGKNPRDQRGLENLSIYLSWKLAR